LKGGLNLPLNHSFETDKRAGGILTALLEEISGTSQGKMQSRHKEKEIEEANERNLKNSERGQKFNYLEDPNVL